MIGMRKAAKRGIELTEDQAANVIFRVNNKQDCSLGITWDTLDIYMDDEDYIELEEIKKEGDIMKIYKPTQKEITAILRKHDLWLRGKKTGIRANLRSADLSSADLGSANLSYLLSIRTILPEGDLVGYKKLRNGVICKLQIPEKAKRVGGMVGRKCRAEYVIVLEGEGFSMHDKKTEYKVGAMIEPSVFDDNPLVECSTGIHFFITREEAERY